MGNLKPEMDYELYTIHYPTLCKVLEDENEKDPERTWGDLDMLRDNIANNLDEILRGTNTAFIEIDNAKKEVTLLWEPLRGKYDVIVPMRTQSRQEQIYNHFKWALNQADRLWKLDQVFKKMNK